jgi:hypothetical protein
MPQRPQWRHPGSYADDLREKPTALGGRLLSDDDVEL